MSSCVFLIEKKDKKGERKEVKRMGRKAGPCPFLLQGTMWEKPFRKGQGARGKGGHAFLCLLIGLSTFLRKRRQERKGRGEEDGKESRVMPLSTARNVVGETF